jgi:hypothetical protein
MKYRNYKYFILTIIILIVIHYKYNNISYYISKINNDKTILKSISKINMNLNESLLWDQLDSKHGYKPLLPTNEVKQNTCIDFFSVWPSDCTVDKEKDLEVRIRVLSYQMVIMNATLTLFVTSTSGCIINYPNIIIKGMYLSVYLIFIYISINLSI